MITSITIYWDLNTIPQGWAYRTLDDHGHEQGGYIPLIDDDDLDGAIRQACHELDIDLYPHDFAREPNIDGGYAVWSA
ncbi:MAG: hypothetical protein O2955_04575 [Planctomycetota bacterium]|nr:hypothetical protein [Planctomycetota bacterium]MDA1211765.1 hypothetical protein [Planctomycetota bacterium]